jgi:(S)-2-hydroxyglutarate dehydrogenase
MESTDVAIIGGGIVGLATAYRLLQRFPEQRVTVIEKEPHVALHQTGHNSGVLHTGIYYQPGSLRASNCRDGKLAIQDFCDREGIDYQLCGKVIVATKPSELPQLQKIYERGLANQIRCELVGPERLKEIEPHAQGVKAIWVPDAGIVDYREVCDRMVDRLVEGGHQILTSARVYGMYRDGSEMVIETTRGEVSAKLVVNCAGLYSDRVTWMSGQSPPAQIVPFRGEYFELKPSAQHLCNGLIYPVPDAEFPFLGAHFTRMIHGGVECGPNAVFAFSREGYQKLNINLYDLAEAVTYRGFLALALRHWQAGLGEMWRSMSKTAFVSALQKLVPEIRADQLVAAPAGVRAQALWPNGQLVDDFLIQEKDLVINICNAPSPAATASLNIGQMVVELMAPRLAG